MEACSFIEMLPFSLPCFSGLFCICPCLCLRQLRHPFALGRWLHVYAVVTLVPLVEELCFLMALLISRCLVGSVVTRRGRDMCIFESTAGKGSRQQAANSSDNFPFALAPKHGSFSLVYCERAAGTPRMTEDRCSRVDVHVPLL